MQEFQILRHNDYCGSSLKVLENVVNFLTGNLLLLFTNDTSIHQIVFT